ncbi:hypothetical protein [Aquimarina sp. 2201CG14-23]|uniref:hypothetical protein n=1 Tax=Aquimarina mycalae TaxID=3040073 RepID=UPI0024782127|nr:hypothetical protein [Aquimarina sp. 2201CG14-23]MDH7447304.1 hypothetical protein [Aquimarina sp. 2201CG14-23]
MIKNYTYLFIILFLVSSFQSCTDNEPLDEINQLENLTTIDEESTDETNSDETDTDETDTDETDTDETNSDETDETDSDNTNPQDETTDDPNTDDTNSDDNTDPQKDRIEAVLTVSKSKYTNAVEGQWILITEAEYNLLATEIMEVSKSGVLESEYNESSNIITTTSSPTTLTNETTHAIMPANSYLFAFKYYAIDASDQPGLKIKQSNTSNTEGYSDVGDPLPRHTASNQEVFFLLKGSNAPTNSGYLAIFKPAGLTIGRKSTTDNNTYFFELGDTSNTSDKTSTPLKLLYQGLSTTTKQWE